MTIRERLAHVLVGKGAAFASGLGLLAVASTSPLACGPDFTSCHDYRNCPSETGGAGAGGADDGPGREGGAAGLGQAGGDGGTGARAGDAGHGDAGRGDAGRGDAGGAGAGGAAGAAGMAAGGDPSSGGAAETGGAAGFGGSAEAGSGGEGGGDACSPNPCGLGACQLHVDSFLCDCPMAYTGDTCELPRFEGLGFMVGDTDSFATDVSKDGRVVVGSSRIQRSTETIETPFTWTHEAGMLPLASLRGRATATNSNGTVIVGQSADRRAFCWTASNGVIDIGVIAGDARSEAIATSEDGSVVVGTSTGPQAIKPEVRPFRWSATGGAAQPLDASLVGTVVSITLAGISSDGLTVVGSGGSAESFAFRWTQAGGVVPLVITGGADAVATAMNSGASVIFGTATFAAGAQIFRWRQTFGATSYETPQAIVDALMGVTIADASDTPVIAVGYKRSLVPGNTNESACMNVDCTDIAVALNDLGVNLEGWQLKRATGISADGKSIVGDGIDPDGNDQAWIARLR